MQIDSELERSTVLPVKLDQRASKIERQIDKLQ